MLVAGGPPNRLWWSVWPHTVVVVQVSPRSSDHESGGQVTDASMSFAHTRPVASSTQTNGSSEISCCSGVFSSHVRPPSFERTTPGSAFVLRAERKITPSVRTPRVGSHD